MAATCAVMELHQTPRLRTINIIRPTYYGASGGAIGRREGYFEDLPPDARLIIARLKTKYALKKSVSICTKCGREEMVTYRYQENWGSDFCPACEAKERAGVMKPAFKFRAWRARGKKGQ